MSQIRVKNGPQKGKVFPIEGDKPMVIGRDPDAGLQIIDKGVSREHAEIFRVGEMVFIRDLGSRNGTFVNEEQLEEELLREGDVVRVGSTQLAFEGARAAQEHGRDVRYEEGGDFKTSLELKVDDLFVGEGGGTGRESEHFRAICQATQMFQGIPDEKKLFDDLLTLIQENIPADHLFLFMKDPASGAIVPRATKQKGEAGNVPISKTILNRVLSESAAILTADAMADERFKTGDSIVLHQIRSVLCVPVQSGNQALGAIYAVNARLAETFDQTDLQLLTTLGSQLGATLANHQLIRSRRKMFLKLIGRLVDALLKEVPGAAGHAERVSHFAGAIAREMGFSDKDALSVRVAALLHDLGKAPAISGLSGAASERAHGAAHVLTCVDFLQDVPGLDEILPIIRAHHERMDGQGVPIGLKRDAIPLGARILAVADAFEHSVYDGKNAGPKPDAAAIRKAFTELGNLGGEQFDLAVLQALMVAYRHNTLIPAPAEPPPAPPLREPAPDEGSAHETNASADAVSEDTGSGRTVPGEGKPPSAGSSKRAAPVGQPAGDEESGAQKLDRKRKS